MNHGRKVRATGMLIEDGKLLIVKQKVSSTRSWSLPGGKVEQGESLEQAVVREVQEETGLLTKVAKLLYVTEKPEESPGLLHISFLLERVSGTLRLPTNEWETTPIRDVKFVPLEALTQYDFSDKFARLALDGFPDAGSYQGHKSNIGL